MIRRIRDLLYDQGFTISGARNKLQELVQIERDKRRAGEVLLQGLDVLEEVQGLDESTLVDTWNLNALLADGAKLQVLRRELREIRELLAC